MDTLSILSFNTMGTPLIRSHQTRNFLSISRHLLNRFRKMGELLNDSDVDILLLQEVHVIQLLNMLKRRLTKYPYVAFEPFVYGPRGGLVIFSKVPIENITYTNFRERGKLKDKALISSIIKNGILCTKIAGTKIMILNTYLTGDFDHKWTPDSPFAYIQESQLRQIADLLTLLKQVGNTVIIGGDFNAPKSSYLYEQFTHLAPVIDPFISYTDHTYHPEYLPSHVPPARLDYIFIPKPHPTLQIVTTEQLFTQKIQLQNKRYAHLSDHIALQLNLKLLASSV